MKVLMITGDKNFTSSERYKLQASVVERLEVLYWGRGEMFPRLPQGEFDVVTAQDPFWRGIFALHSARKLGAKFNVQVHTDFAAQTIVKKIIGAYVLRRAANVRVVSHAIKESLAHLHLKAPIVVLPVYVDVERFKNVPHIQHETFKKTILWFGRFESEKNPLFALEVLERVRTSGVDAGLILLGKGTQEPLLRAKAEGMPVEFVPWQDPLPYLQKADAVLCTSRFEGWGASIVEALAAGVPVVAPDVGIAREAGAYVALKEQLADRVAAVLTSGERATLTLHLQSAGEWAKGWRESLLATK